MHNLKQDIAKTINNTSRKVRESLHKVHRQKVQDGQSLADLEATMYAYLCGAGVQWSALRASMEEYLQQEDDPYGKINRAVDERESNLRDMLRSAVEAVSK